MRKKETLIISIIVVIILIIIIIMSINNNHKNDNTVKHPDNSETIYSFAVDKSLELNANNLSNTAHATVKLYDSDDKKYNLYLNIENNAFIDKDATIILTITNPNKEIITNIDNLAYNETLNGFDITNYIGKKKIISDYLITKKTTQEWEFSVRLITHQDITESFKATIEFSE